MVVDAISVADGRTSLLQETLAELRTRLARPNFDRDLSRELKAEVLGQRLAVSAWVPIVAARMGCRDLDNKKLLETAIVDQATVLVTGDRDLLVMSPFRGVPILRPGAFVER